MTDVVIGAGIVGASCAYHLRQAGREVVLVDAGEPGRATDAGLGVVSALDDGSHGEVWGTFGAAAAEYYPVLAAELAELGIAETGWARVGQLVTTAPGDENRLSTVMRHGKDWCSRHGAEALGTPELVGPDDIQRLWPGLAASAAVLFDRVGGVDGRRFRAALTDAFTRLGGTVTAGTATLSRAARGVVEVDVDGSPLAAENVVVAAGVWSASLLGGLGFATDWLTPQRGQLLHARLPGCSGRPIVSTPGRNYLACFPGDRVVFGSTRESDAGYDPVTTVDGLAALTGAALLAAPILAGAAVLETRVGLRPQPADGLPVLGRVPGLDTLVLATGMGHTGLTWGPHTGRVVAELVATGEPVPSAFEAARFVGSA